jgi:hypothetical protein
LTRIAIKLGRRLGTGAACSHQRPHAARWLANQPEAVSTNVIHVRIDRRNAGGHGQHRLDGVAAFREDRAAILNGGCMRGTNDAAAMSGTMETHSAPAPDRKIIEIFDFFASTTRSQPPAHLRMNFVAPGAHKWAGTYIAFEEFRPAAREDIMEKLVEICFEVVIVALICVSLFSGNPAFETTQATAKPAPVALMAP